MLVGEAPGADEDKGNRPFVGQAGELLNRCLERAGLKRKQVYITNCTKCRPPDNRDPTPQERGACFVYLAEEIATVNPKVIVCVGLNALKSLTGETGLAKNRGRIIPPSPKVRVGNAKIVAMTHPAAYLHQGRRESVLDSIVEDLKFAQKLAGTPTVTKNSRTLLLPPYDLDDLYAGLRRLSAAHVLACDIEWLAPRQEEVSWPWSPGCEQISISFTGRVKGELCTTALSWPPPPGGLKMIAAFMRKRTFTFHNAMADVLWLLFQNLDPTVTGDTMLMAYLLDENRRAALAQLAPLVAGVDPGWKKKPWHRRPESVPGWTELLSYNADDTEATLQVHEQFETQLDDLGTERRANILRLYNTLLLPAVKPLARAALNGAPVDEAALHDLLAEHRALLNKHLTDLATATHLNTVQAAGLAGSWQQTLHYLREGMGLDITTTREEELADWKDQFPVVADIQGFKHERKMVGTYLEPWATLLARQGDGHLHTVYRIGSTRTGRTSAELELGGSIQLSPRGKPFKRLYAARPGYKILAADYSQIEMRITAWLAPEPNMRRLFNEGADLHATTAAYVKAFRAKHLSVADFWKQRDLWVGAVTPQERQDAKGVNFGFLYGMQAAKFVGYAKNNYGAIFTFEEAEDAHDGYFKLYDHLQLWHDRCQKDLARGYTLTPFGRYRTDIQELTQAINTPIQSTASDLTMFASTVVDERLQDLIIRIDDMAVFPFGFIHDSILVEARDDVVEDVKRIMQESMECPPLDRVGIKEIPVPLKADVAVGQNWGDAK